MFYVDLQDTRLSLTVLNILRTPPHSSPDSSSVSDFDMDDEHEITQTDKLGGKIKRGFRKMSVGYTEPPSGISAVHA